MRTNTTPGDPISVTGILVSRSPVRDSFVAYAIVSVALSFPFLFLLVMPQTIYQSIPFPIGHFVFWVWLAFVATIAAFGIVALLRFSSGKTDAITLPATGSTQFKIMCAIENHAKYFMVLYGVLPILFALIHVFENPCKLDASLAALGCDVTVIPLYDYCFKTGTLVAGFCMSGSLIWATFLKTNKQRWRLLWWNFLLCSFLMVISNTTYSRKCNISCHQGTPPTSESMNRGRFKALQKQSKEQMRMNRTPNR